MGVVVIVFFIIIGILAFCGYNFERSGKEKSSNQLDNLRKEHNVSLCFVTPAGYFAFCDDEQKIYNYVNVLSTLKVFDYNKIIKFDRSPYIKGISCWALNPTYTEFVSGDVGNEQLPLLVDKVSSIIKHNSDLACKAYYEGIFPEDGADVTIKGVCGYNSLIPSDMKKVRDLEIWSDEKFLYLLPLFNYEGYMLNNECYKLIAIEKRYIIDLSREGDVHYTTEIRGGGGGGTSVTGAIVGGLIAGEVGAIIGSRKEAEPITSSTKQIDDRITSLKLLDDNNELCEIQFDYNDYYAISKIMNNN